MTDILKICCAGLVVSAAVLLVFEILPAEIEVFLMRREERRLRK